VLEKIADILQPDGALILGHAESVRGDCDAFMPVEQAPTIFVKNKAAAQRLASVV